MAKKILRCDRCGFELTEPEDIQMAYDGREAWHAAARARGIKPRGILPCKHYIRCGGEIVEVTRWSDRARRLLRRRGRPPAPEP